MQQHPCTTTKHYDGETTLSERFKVTLRPVARERKTTRVYESTKRIAKPRHDRAATFRKLFEVTVDEATAELTKACRRCTNDCSGLTLDDVVECRQKNYADSNAGLTARLANLFWAFSR